MKQYRVKPDSRLNLDTCNPDDTGEYKKTDQDKEKAKAITVQLIGRLEELQERVRAHGVSETTYYAWKRKYGSMAEPDVKRLMELEKEKARLSVCWPSVTWSWT